MPSRKLAPYAALLLVPVALFVASRFLLDAKGPFWLGTNLDPDYQYLLNALNVAQGIPPGHTDHPGTFVQTIGAGVVRAVHLVGGQGSLDDDVIRRHETYLDAFAVACALWALLGVAAVGLATWVATRSLALAVLAQAASFVSKDPWLALTRANPEPVLLGTGAMLGALVVACTPRLRRSPAFAVALGLLVASALTSKVTAVPLVLAPLVLLSGWRALAAFGAAVAGGAVLMMTPAWGHLVGFRWLMVQMATHTGTYGAGPAGYLDPGAYARALLTLLAEPAIWASLLAGIGGLVVARRRREDGDADGSASRAPIALLAAQVAAVLMVARHPGSRYLIPAMSLTGAVAALALPRLRSIGLRLAPAVALAAVVAFGATQAWSLGRKLSADRAAQLDVSARRDAMRARNVMFHYPASSPAFALHFADEWAGWRHLRRVESAYPGTLFLNKFWMRLEPKNPTVRRSPDGTVEILMQGAPLTPEDLKRLPFRGAQPELLHSNGLEALYRLTLR